jgi:hypothetical protein
VRAWKRDLLVGLLLVLAGMAGLLWQIEGPSSARASAAGPTLVCPLGSHGLPQDAVSRDLRLAGAGWR